MPSMEQTELIFEVHEADEGGYWARALGESIFTQADTWEELRANVREATECHFDVPEERPRIVRLHLVRDEVFAL
jgi:predicted RNase H-like HicB family nuclease